MTDEIDFIAEHPKADMSNVDVFKVNGKAFISVNRILEIIGEEEKRWIMPTPDEARVLWWAYHDLRYRFEKFKGK